MGEVRTGTGGAPDPWAVRPPVEPLPLAVRPRAGPALRLAVAVAGGAAPVLRLVWLGRPEWALQLLAATVVFALPVLVRRERRAWGSVVVVAAAVAVAVVARTGFGRSPALVAALGVAVAVAVVDGWWSPAAWYRRGPVATLAVPVMVLAGVAWFRSGAPAPAVAGLAAALAVVVACGRRPVGSARVEAVVLRAVGAVGDVAARAVVLVVALPLLYLPGTVLGPTLALVRRAPEERGWLAAPVLARGHARAPFAGTDRAVARRRHLRGAAVTAVVAAAALAVVWAARPATEAPVAAAPDPVGPGLVLEVPFAERPAFRDQPDAGVVEEEQRRLASSLVADPVTRTAVPDFSGTTTNVSDGVRRTAGSACGGCPRVRAWLVGGSAAFGLGQRDDATIASQLVRSAAADGIDLEVVNLAVPGWTGWQEAAAVGVALAEREPPDVVIVLDGFNDVLGTVLGAVAGAGGGSAERPVIAAEDVAALDREWRPLSGAGDAGTVGRAVAARHAAPRASIRAAAASVGAEAVFVVQPDALAAPGQRVAAEQVVDRRLAADLDYLDAALEASATAMAADGALNLRHVLDAEDGPVFGDLVHTNERGAAVVAAALHERLRPLLAERARRP